MLLLGRCCYYYLFFLLSLITIIGLALQDFQSAASVVTTGSTPAAAAAIADGAPLRVRYEELQQRYDSLQAKYDTLHAAIEKAMETNIRRIAKLNEQNADLQNQLKQATSKRSVVPQEVIGLNDKIKVCVYRAVAVIFSVLAFLHWGVMIASFLCFFVYI